MYGNERRVFIVARSPTLRPFFLFFPLLHSVRYNSRNAPEGSIDVFSTREIPFLFLLVSRFPLNARYRNADRAFRNGGVLNKLTRETVGIYAAF